MKKENRTLYIDALTYKRHKAYGYNEYLFNLLNYFYEHRDLLDYDKIIIICEESQISDFLKFKDKFEIKSFRFNNQLKRIFIQSIWNILLPIKKNDVILFTANYSTFFKKCKQVLVIHDLLFLHGNLLKSKLVKFQRKLLVPLSLKNANRVIAISKFTKNDILSNYKISEDKITVIYNYFNFKKYGPIDENKQKERTIISVASSAPHKNVRCILTAFLEYKQKGGSFKLEQIGKIPKNTIEYHILENIQSKYPDSVSVSSNLTDSELAEKYNKAAIYVSASQFEGLGMPIIESMYFGLTLILPDSPSIFKEVSDCNALFFDSNNPDELCRIFLELEKQNTYQRKNYDLSKYDSQNTSGKYVSTLNELHKLNNTETL